MTASLKAIMVSKATRNFFMTHSVQRGNSASGTTRLHALFSTANDRSASPDQGVRRDSPRRRVRGLFRRGRAGECRGVENNAAADIAGDRSAGLDFVEDAVLPALRRHDDCTVLGQTQRVFIVIDRVAKAGIARNRPFRGQAGLGE